jgi:hypothetical protein
MTQLYVLFLQSEEITTTYYDYELQLSKLYMRHVYNRFKEHTNQAQLFLSVTTHHGTGTTLLSTG